MPSLTAVVKPPGRGKREIIRCTEAYSGDVGVPPVGGTFRFQMFIQTPSPEIWRKTISGGEEVLAGKWGGLFLGYLWSAPMTVDRSWVGN